MTQSKRGFATVEANGQKYPFKFTTNAICEYSDENGKSIFEDFKALFETNDMRILRSIMACGLSTTKEEAGDIIDEIGIEAAGKVINDAVVLFFPEPDKDDEAKAAPNAPKARKAT